MKRTEYKPKQQRPNFCCRKVSGRLAWFILAFVLFVGCQGAGKHETFLCPEWFNAKGDAVHDDTRAFRKLTAYAGRDTTRTYILVLKAGRKYLLSGKIRLDVSRIRAVEGNNGYLVLTADTAGLEITGRKILPSASPVMADNQKLCKEEFTPYIRDLQIFSQGSSPSALYVGTGLSVTGTMGLVISGCHFFHLRTAIELKGLNRNIIITGNSIWDCRYYGIHWNQGSLHQQIISANHISYMKKCLFFDNVNGHNIHITGNDIEGGSGEQEGLETLVHFLADSDNADMSQIQIAGNSIEEHNAASGPLVSFENKRNRISVGNEVNKLDIIEITGNEFSGARNNAIEMENVTRISINGNSFTGLGGYGLALSQYIKEFSCTGNTFTGGLNNCAMASGGIFIDCDTLCDFIFHGNVCTDLRNYAFLAGDSVGNGPSFPSGNPMYLERINISDNIFSLAGTQKAGFKLKNYFVDICLANPASSIREFLFANNQISGRSGCENGVRIWCGHMSQTMIRNNQAYNIPVREYCFPSSAAKNVLVTDNI